MNEKASMVFFSLDGWQYALALSVVRRVIHIAEVTPLPKAPDVVLGAINIQGTIVPVFNVRKRFLLPPREIQLNDQLILANTSRRPVALWVDEVIGVSETHAADIISSEKVLPNLEYVQGVMKTEDGLILIHDLDRFLSLEEEKALDEAME